MLAAMITPLPDTLAKALEQQPAAAQAFAALSPTCRREYAEWIAGAKRDDTRAHRVAATVERLIHPRTTSPQPS